MHNRHAPRSNAPPKRLPSLDLLKGFESAARLLSFTKAGAELHLTQSAVSRQVQELEDQIGVTLFHRRYRALALTEAGQQLYPTAAQVLASIRVATERLRAGAGQRVLSVATSSSFASLWLIPRLAGFSRVCPDVDVRISAQARAADLEREGIDVAVRYCAPALVPAHALRLFGEQALPVCSPQLRADQKRPLVEPADLRRHVLLRLEDAEGRYPWLNWRTWFEAVGLEGLRPARTLTFSSYDQLIAAAVEGHGVALGRIPLARSRLADGSLVAPFPTVAQSARAYFLLVARDATARTEVAAFVRWLRAEAARDEKTPLGRLSGRRTVRRARG